MYGFIESATGGPDVFVHHSGLIDETYYPKQGDVVTFNIENKADGRTRAVKVKKVDKED
jgi:CspA family cold shock protein